MRLSKSRMGEETDDRTEAISRGSSSEACFSLVNTEPVKGKGKHRLRRKEMCHDRWKDGKTISL